MVFLPLRIYKCTGLCFGLTTFFLKKERGKEKRTERKKNKTCKNVGNKISPIYCW